MPENAKSPTGFTIKGEAPALSETPLGNYVKTPYSSNTAKIRERAAEGTRITSKTRAFLRRETGYHSKND